MNTKLNTLINYNTTILYSKSVPTKECTLCIYLFLHKKTEHLHFTILRPQPFINYVHKRIILYWNVITY